MRGQGQSFTDDEGRCANDCLADSLLQLLVRGGFLAECTWDERRMACAQNRRALVDGLEDLRPRQRDSFTNADLGPDPRAYLQHDVHAASTVRFFMEWFGSRGKKRRELPAAGICLSVRSRFDSAVLPLARSVICAGRDAVGEPVEFALYNSTGSGTSGYHYDPVFRERSTAVIRDAE